MSNIIRKIIHLSELKWANTVEIAGELETVDLKYLRYCSFMGWTYQGKPYRKGITKIIFKVPTLNGFRYS